MRLLRASPGMEKAKETVAQYAARAREELANLPAGPGRQALATLVDYTVNPWDLAPMPVILQEAGGRFTSLDGSSRYDTGSGIAANAVLHEALFGVLKAG